jgi:steroid 5-alpha reductase family enzyme
MKNNTIKHLIIIVIVLLIAALVATAGSQGSVTVAGWPLFALCAGVSFVIQWLAFIPAWKAQSEKFFDLTGSLTFISLILLALLFSPAPDARSLLMALLVSLWAARLGSFLFLRIRKDGSDGRFDEIKPVFTRFLLTWTLQGLWVFLTMSAALVAITSSERVPLEGFAFAGLLVWLIGFRMEVTADAQKRRFRENPANAGRFINTGLWAWSRHPNYFGEILLWIGVTLIAVPVLSGWQWVIIISPVFVTLLLTRVSGIPLLEARAAKRWGNDPEYQLYLATTPRLIPFPRSHSASQP